MMTTDLFTQPTSVQQMISFANTFFCITQIVWKLFLPDIFCYLTGIFLEWRPIKGQKTTDKKLRILNFYAGLLNVENGTGYAVAVKERLSAITNKQPHPVWAGTKRGNWKWSLFSPLENVDYFLR